MERAADAERSLPIDSAVEVSLKVGCAGADGASI